MEQRISMVTLGVTDLPRARAFYEAMGWRGQQVQGTVFFQAGGMVLVLWDSQLLAEDSGGGEPGEGRRTALAQNVRTQAEVDAVVAAAADAGGTVTRAPAATSYGGYAGYFTDPDGHAWEIACNPGFPLADDGTITVPDLGGG